ncbi:MAG: hypothetical protein J6A95_04640 [Clostridia bacterium]|nr:hypothetical protein [Clostridia bacterium]
MEKISRIFKITIAVLAILLLGVMGGFATTVTAEVPSLEAGFDINLSHNNDIVISPEGIKIGEGDVIPNTEPYIVFGSGEKPLIFKNETNEAVTYNVVLHQASIFADQHAIIMDTGVNINLYVYGLSELVSNVYVFQVNDTGNGLKSSVNLVVQENSWLSMQALAKTMIADIDTEITVEKGEYNGNGSLINEVHTAFVINGETYEHNLGYDIHSDTACKMYCTEECSFIDALVDHKMGYTQLNGLVHLNGCENCGYGTEEEHTFVNEPVSGKEHTRACVKCFETLGNEEHTFVDGVCTGCNAEQILLHIDESNKETIFIDFQTGVNHAKMFGGTLKLLKEYDAGGNEIQCANVDYTFDLNGYTLGGSYLFIGSYDYTGTLTLIDSSENKTGYLASSGVTNLAYGGTIIIDGAKVEAMVIVSGENSVIIIKNVYTDQMDIGLYNGSFQILDSEFTGNFDISAYEVKENCISIARCTFGSIALNDAPWGYNLTDTLAEGYAFSTDGEFVSGNCTVLNDVTVSLHTHNFENADYASLNGYHISACKCGVIDSTANKELHTVENDEYCTVCGFKMLAKTEIDGETLYYSDIDDAFGCLFSSNKDGKITLLDNGTSYSEHTSQEGKNYILDLNGYEITVIAVINVSSESVLTVQDTSQLQKGCIYAEESSFTAICVYGELIFNSGSICGIIDLIGVEEYTAKATINGGTFMGAVSFILYDYSQLDILGGTFTETNFVDIYGDTATVKITLRGGVFENGIEIYDNNGELIILSLLPKDECEICFVDKNGSKVELDSDDYAYYAYLRVKHNNEKTEANGDSHKIYCDTCSLVLLTEKHKKPLYILDESNKANHKVICGVCEYEIASEEHSGGKATCVAGAECSYCEAEYGEINENGHEGGKATCVSKAVCELCQKEYGELNLEAHSSKETKFVQNKDDATKHDKIYLCCNAIIDTGSHENGVTTCTDKAICTECGLEYGSEPQGHKYDNACDQACNICNAKRDTSGHKYDNSCDKECNECKATRNIDHLYGLDGVCIACGATTTPTPEPKAHMGTGAIIGIILGSVAVFGGGAFSLIWFVLRKKF